MVAIVCRVSLPAGQVVRHLESAYGTRVEGVAELDRDVFRVERRDGPAWVVRVFPPQRPVDAVEGDATILRNLASAGFPAERCAASVSTLDDRGVLVTDFVDGIRPDRPGRTFAVLGALLGGLHARPAAGSRLGGAWHHLAPTGGPADEIDAALALLQSVRARTSGADRGRCDLLLDAVAGLDDAADLPHAFVHPDFVPANAIQIADGGLIIVDWAGRGPRPAAVVPGVSSVGRRGTRPAAGGCGRLALPQAHPADRGRTGTSGRRAARPPPAARLLVGRRRPPYPDRGC